MNRRDFRRLARTRLDDAKALLKARRFDAAYYLAGYVVECALKACICKKTVYDFPTLETKMFYIHDLEKLSEKAGIADAFKRDRDRDPKLKEYWDVVKDWQVDSRYRLGGRTRAEATKAILRAIEDKQHGVLECISKYW